MMPMYWLLLPIVLQLPFLILLSLVFAGLGHSVWTLASFVSGWLQVGLLPRLYYTTYWVSQLGAVWKGKKAADLLP